MCRPLLAAILFTYSYRDRSTIPNQIHTKSTIFVPPPKSSVHGSGLKPCENNAFPCRSTRGYRYLLSLGEVSKRETSILNLAAGGRRMESLFLSPSRLVSSSSSFSPHHLSAPVLDLRSTFHRSRRRSSVTRLLPPLPLFDPRLMLSSRLVAFFLGPSLPLSLLFLFPTLMRISIEYRTGRVHFAPCFLSVFLFLLPNSPSFSSYLFLKILYSFHSCHMYAVDIGCECIFYIFSHIK